MLSLGFWKVQQVREASVLSTSCIHSVRISVVGCKCMQVAQLAKAALDVCHMDLNVVLKATEEPPPKKREREREREGGEGEKAAHQNRFL